ncbi:MAG: acyl-CoA dehydrogenase family protein [Chitinophagales bacterium]|nr:acyl-CoA dehydrogenase family protein [Chitinophagales bacterium]MCZ2392705.1 acyl-CoA dehydrogenase family protein [Chitinophagales bacterium]
MNFEYSENQKMISQTVRDFAEKNIRPYVLEWDESQHFPADTLRALGELGLMGIVIPEEYGGSGLGYYEYITALIEIGRVDSSLALSVAAHNSLCTNHIYKFGNEEQRRKWVPKLASGQWIGSWGLTEPNTGSDAGRMQCVAKQEGEDWVINGTKNFITHGISSNITVVIARTGEPLDSHGMTAFVVERGTPGFSGGKKENKLGMRCSETAELIFDNCRIPKENVLGKVGDGFIQAMKILDGGRISIAALSLSIGQGALDASIAYSKQREQFGKPISEFQGISFKLAEMAAELEAAKLLTFQAADKLMRDGVCTKESAIAKYYASEMCVRVATEAVQIHGGYGYIKDFPVEKFYRDSKLCTIGEGTSEVQKLVIARQILK